MTLQDIYSPTILNIFCDASILPRGKYFSGCYGAIAICEDKTIAKTMKIATDTTNNNSEIKALRLGVELAIQFSNLYEQINIFSDSQVSIFGIRDRIYKWKLSRGALYGSTGTMIKNQEIFIEILAMVVQYNPPITFYHQMGHVNKYKDLEEAVHVFATSNVIRNGIDIEFIKYISGYNNMIDKSTRNYLHQISLPIIMKNNFTDPVKFEPVNFANTINLYHKWRNKP